LNSETFILPGDPKIYLRQDINCYILHILFEKITKVFFDTLFGIMKNKYSEERILKNVLISCSKTNYLMEFFY